MTDEKLVAAKAREMKAVSLLLPGESVHFLKRVESILLEATADGPTYRVTFDDGTEASYPPDAAVPVL